MPDDLEQSIQENAQQPAKATGDSGSVEQHPVVSRLSTMVSSLCPAVV